MRRERSGWTDAKKKVRFLQDGTADRRRHIVLVERVEVGGAEERPGPEVFVGEDVAARAAEAVAAGLGRDRDVDGTGAALGDAEGVGLDGHLLDGVRVRRQVGDALNDVARHVQAVHDELVAAGVAAVGAHVDGLFGGEVVGRVAGRATADRTASRSRRAQSPSAPGSSAPGTAGRAAPPRGRWRAPASRPHRLPARRRSRSPLRRPSPCRAPPRCSRSAA